MIKQPGIACAAVLLGMMGTTASVADGKAVYQQHCATCHATGIDGAPKLGDAPSWASRSPEWSAVLEQHAAHGFVTMSPQGGAAVDEESLSAAVDYMVAQVSPPSVLAKGNARGRVVYQQACGRCHDTGRKGAPVIGDAEAWAVRTPHWRAMLEQHAKEGFLLMPAKGGAPELSDDDVSAAVDFMMSWLTK